MFRGSVKSNGYLLHSPVSPSLPLPCVTACHHISTRQFGWAIGYLLINDDRKQCPKVLWQVVWWCVCDVYCALRHSGSMRSSYRGTLTKRRTVFSIIFMMLIKLTPWPGVFRELTGSRLVKKNIHVVGNTGSLLMICNCSYTVIPRLTKIIRFGITFVSRNLR